MIVPTYDQGRIVNEDGHPTGEFALLVQQLLQNMQLSVSDEGYLIPSVSAAADSVDPSTAGGQKAIIQASWQNPATAINSGTQTVTVGVQPGTLIFDPDEVNGGGGAIPKWGKLFVLLRDGTFHAITNI